MNDELYILTRYTPFWAIPLLLISLECAYLFWIRKKTKFIVLSITLAFISLSAVGFYYWAGGPEKSVKRVKKTVREYTE